MVSSDDHPARSDESGLKAVHSLESGLGKVDIA